VNLRSISQKEITMSRITLLLCPRRCAAALLAASLVPGCVPPDHAEEETEVETSSILDGALVPNGSYPAVGKVLSIHPGGTTAQAGTGTLIGRRHVLTAAHVVDNNPTNPGKILFRLYPGGQARDYTVKAVHIHPSYSWLIDDRNRGAIWDDHAHPTEYDVAVLELNETLSVPFVTIWSSEPQVGTAVSFLGYGDVGSGGNPPVANPDGKLYRGTNKISAMSENAYTITYNRGTSSIWSGDSGGPFLVGSYLVGVNRSTRGSFTYESHAEFTRLSRVRTWISRAMSNNTALSADYLESKDGLATGGGRYFTRPPLPLETLRHFAEGRSFHTTTDVDSLSFSLPATRSVTVSLARPHLGDQGDPWPSLAVYRNGVEHPVSINYSNSTDPAYEYCLFVADLPEGVYDVRIANAGQSRAWYIAAAAIDGWMASSDPFEPDREGNSYRLRALDVSASPGKPLERSIDLGEDDWASITLSSSRSLTLETGPLDGDEYGGDTVLGVYSLDGQLLGENDDRENSRYSSLTLTLPAGQYLVGVRAYGADMTVPGYSLRTR